mmetsp:Transcript_107400/g.321167  ORF Transcript_107400/g.321167 Transcript_107400/m.321167 type:complete len:378 (-) Transcript_107400:86-1219(-)
MDLSHAFLHTLGEKEAKLLAQLRAQVPDVVAKAHALSEEAKALKRQTIWGVDIEAEGEASDIVLLKYLRAEELNVDKAAERLVQTLVFRADCCIDALTKAELPEHFRGHDFVSGLDTEGRPVMISRFGGMDLQLVFGDVEAFVRYRAQIMERAIALLSFKKGAVEDLCQVHDYSGVPLLFKTAEIKNGVAAVSKVFSEHYPETKGKTIFVNFPAAFSKLWKAFSLVIPERTRKKFLILGEADQASLFEHISPDIVPEVLGGMLRDPPGTVSTKPQVVPVRSTEEVVLVEVDKPGASIAWELRVCSLEIAYEVVFLPAGGGGEEVIVRRTEPKQYLQASEGVVSGEWTAEVPGSLRCRFRNECAWFKHRLCVCRAEAK